MVTNLDAALAYARADIPVFPCGPNKEPLTPHGFKDATTDPKKIARWWDKDKWPDALIGMPTGKLSGISIVDLDKKNGKDGFKFLPDWKKRSKLIVITMHGGAHLYFLDPDGRVRCTSNVLADGVDTRGNGGYVIVPPSKGYQWVNGKDLNQLEPFPEDLMPPKRERKAGKTRVKNTEPVSPERAARALAVIPSDDYDDWYKCAAALRNEFGDDGFDLFEEWSKKSSKYSPDKCEKKWDEVEGITDIKIGTIFHWANKIDLHWDEEEEEELPEGITLNDFVAFMPDHDYLFIDSMRHWPAISINARFNKIIYKNKKIQPSTWLDKCRPVEEITWLPGAERLIKDHIVVQGGWIEKKGITVFNQYIPPKIKLGDANKAKRWVDLVKKIYPHDAEHILDFFAQRVQHPEIKINHALVLGGEPGIGKDTILVPLRSAVGIWNFADIDPQTVFSQFNPYIKSVIVRVSEAHDMGDFNRNGFYTHTKTLIASPPDTLSCNEKHTKPYMVFNVTGVIITTNHKTDGLFLPADDRRHYVTWSPMAKGTLPDKYWNDLYHWYDYEDGHSHVAAYLHQRDISKFDPKAAPPQTEAFFAIVDTFQSPEVADLINVLNTIEHNKTKGKDTLKDTNEDIRPTVTTWREVFDNSVGQFSDWLEGPKNRRAFVHRMGDCGYTVVRNAERPADHLWGSRGNLHQIYGRKDISEKERQNAARRYIEQQKQHLKPKKGS